MTPIWWLLAFPPALLILYFLKLKRQEMPISSTMLWRRSLEDLHVNAPFQKLRRSLLFWLQLFVLAVLIASLWRPRCNHEDFGGRHILVLIDTSASMMAEEEGGTRLEHAKNEALKVIATMASTDRMMLLTFAARVVTLQPLTSDRALLETKVKSIEPTTLPTNVASALSSAHSIAESLPSSQILILGDSCYTDLEDLPLEVKRSRFQFFSKSSDLDNVAITQADVRRSLGRATKTEAFALVRNFSKSEKKVSLSLHHENTLIDARTLSIDPGESGNALFDVSELSAGMLRLSIDGEDSLPGDDEVWIDLSPPREISAIVVGEKNAWIDYALRSATNFFSERVSTLDFLGPEIQKRLASPNPPVVIYDRWQPESVPDVPSIFIGVDPPLPDSFAAAVEHEAQGVIDWDQVHPINRELSFDDIGVKKAKIFADQETELYRSLVDTPEGSIIGILYRPAESGGLTPSIYVGFNILDSNWPLGHFSFPIFFSNSLKWLGTRYSDSRTRWRTGEPLVFVPKVEAGEDVVRKKYEFVAPDGTRESAVMERNGSLVYGNTAIAGIYSLEADGAPVARFGVALLDDGESRLSPLEKIDFGDYQRAVSAELTKQTRELWPWFALAALAFMFLEWYVYHRRVYV